MAFDEWQCFDFERICVSFRFLSSSRRYCATCTLGDIEDTLPEGYIVVDAETNNFHPNGRVLDVGESAFVGCAEGFNATSGTQPVAVNCTLDSESDGNGFMDRSATFEFVSHPPEGGGLTCFPEDELPMQLCDTNEVLPDLNMSTQTPGLIDIDSYVNVSCQPGYTDPSVDVDEGTLFCGAAPNVTDGSEPAAFLPSNLECYDVDALCILTPGSCTQLADRQLSFEECDTMLGGGALIAQFNAAFLDFLAAFISPAVIPGAPSLSPTCGSIFLNLFFPNATDQAAFRASLIEAMTSQNVTELVFEFNGQQINFSLEDLTTVVRFVKFCKHPHLARLLNCGSLHLRDAWNDLNDCR